MVLRIIKLSRYVCSRRLFRSLHESTPLSVYLRYACVSLCHFAYSLYAGSFFAVFFVLFFRYSRFVSGCISGDRRRIVFMHSKFIKLYNLPRIPDGLTRFHCPLSLSFFNFCNATQDPFRVKR